MSQEGFFYISNARYALADEIGIPCHLDLATFSLSYDLNAKRFYYCSSFGTVNRLMYSNEIGV